MCTGENSICIRCDRLFVNVHCKIIAGGGRTKLLTNCYIGGKNAGDRNTCKRFTPAPEDVVKERLDAFKV